ncbi:dihydrolipoamide acetyltransferase family protein [Microbacterium sp. JZ31]|uniref:dihydrolipoamide acetyltransferase family protein n=1 Tax=Microbacterium sp. JZ31 TaxID=1906274 RepID=UPI0019338FDD|nr:dihydrolipoamide acetyltransferase family protein [Microbacterium sp. JZ31]
MSVVFRLPDLGEGLTESEIVSWKVAEGDAVALNQVIAEVETAKAVVDLPSPYAGVVRRLHASEGETLEVGAPLVEYDVEGESDAPAEPEPVAPASGEEPSAPEEPPPSAPPGGPGLEPDESDAVDRTEEEPAEEEPAEESVAVLVGSVKVAGGRKPKRAARTFAQTPFVREQRQPARAFPPVRRLAKERGIDLAAVVPTGEGGVVTRADLDRAVAAPSARSSHRERVSGLRRQTAKAMTAALAVPHAACFLQVDVTETLRLARDLAAEGSPSPTLLSLASRAVILAAARTPGVNATFHADAEEIEFHDRINLGIAVATERGLVVASVDDADRLDATQLAGAIAARAAEARDGSIGVAALTSSTLTISNVGVFGVDGGIPLLTPGQSAIVALGAVRRLPWEHEGAVALRDVMTITVSFDHRVIDGREASAFVRDIGRVLERPGLALARG